MTKKQHSNIEDLRLKYSSYIDLSNCIYKLRHDDLSEIMKRIDNVVNDLNVDPFAFIHMISDVTYYRHGYLAEYTELYDLICKKYNLPDSLIRSHFFFEDILYLKYGKITYAKKRCQGKTLDDVIQLYPKDTEMYYLLHDDVRGFASVWDQKEKEYEDQSYLDYCAQYGSVKCFKFLRSNGFDITPETIGLSFVGQEKEIITECLDHLKKPTKEDMKLAILSHDMDIVIALKEKFGLEVDLEKCSIHFNLEAFFYGFESYRKSFPNCSSFGSLTLVEDFYRNITHKQRNTVNSLNKNIMFYAAGFNYTELVKYLLKLKVEREEFAEDGSTAYSTACENNALDTLILLNEVSFDLTIPLFEYLTQINCTEVIAYLIDQCKKHKWLKPLTPGALSNAVGLGFIDLAIIMLDKGFDVNMTEDDGKIPLHYAAMEDDVDMVKLLLERGADKTRKDEEGKTPYDIAVEFERENVLDLLRIEKDDDQID